MRRLVRHLALALTFAATAATAGPTDANLVTGLDISQSVGAEAHRAQLRALAAAFRAPEFIAAVRRGPAGRVGVAVFAWHTAQVEVVPWTLVASGADAEAVARSLEARLAVDVSAEAAGLAPRFSGRLTGVAAAIEYARALLAAAPWLADRRVLNLVGNGADNLRGESRTARDRMLATGATVNGVLIDGDGAARAHYADEVVGGAGAFLLEAAGPAELAALMRRKLLADLVAALP